MMGIVVCFLMAGSALAASGVLTVTRAISQPACSNWWICSTVAFTSAVSGVVMDWTTIGAPPPMGDRKSTRLNSSHLVISYAVFCLKKKKKNAARLVTEYR